MPADIHDPRILALLRIPESYVVHHTHLGWAAMPAGQDPRALGGFDLAYGSAYLLEDWVVERALHEGKGLPEGFTVDLGGPHGPRALLQRQRTREEVLEALPAGWTVSEADWDAREQLVNGDWTVRLTRRAV